MRSVAAPAAGSAASTAARSASIPAPVAAEIATPPSRATSGSTGAAVRGARLPGVRVADERDARHARAPPAGALQTPGHLHALELASDLHHAAADDATVRFELGLARPPSADAATEPLEVRPLPDEPRQQIRELRQLDLQLALARARALGEDVEDQRRPVDDLQAERLGDVALLARRERVVADDEVGRPRLRGAPELLDLPLAEVESRCR